MASSAAQPPPAAALESISRILSEICGPDASSDSDSPWGPHRAFTGYAQRLRVVAGHLSRSDLPSSSPAVTTALRGISGDLDRARDPLSAYRSRSRIYVLINCVPLSAALRDRATAVGRWLALLDSPLSPLPDLRKRAADLSRDMQQPDIKVTENEERVYLTLQKEAEVRRSSKAVQSAIILDLARALGTDPADHAWLAEQIRLLGADLSGPAAAPAERKILMSLEKIFDSWLAEPLATVRPADADFEEDAHIPPFKNFLCPLTKEVMKDPVVVLESSQNYERTAIKYWFDRCLEDGRDPTCPVTGQVLRTMELRPNIGLAGTIEEWVNRNVEVQIKSTVQCLGEGSSSPAECIERSLDNVYRISEEHPSSRYRVRNAGIVALVVQMLKDQSKKMGSQMRTKALMAMYSMAKDEESQLIMLEEGMGRCAIRSLTANSEKEREYALRLLLELSINEAYCRKIASEKGALFLLSSMVGNVESPSLSNLAEEVLINIEKVEENIQHLATAGRFQPLLTRLCEGTEEVRMMIATLVGKMTLTNNGKDCIARKGGKVLVDMLSSNPQGRESSLQAVYNLSTLDDNATVLVDLGAFPALTNILFETQKSDSCDTKELAAKIIANIVSNYGHWEFSVADKDGHKMQSEFVIHRFLEVLPHSSSNCQAAILHVLCGIASSPQASDMAAIHIKSGNGIIMTTTFLGHPENDHRIYALRLLALLSERLGQDIAEELRASNKLTLLKEKLLDAQCSIGEKCEITCILSNLTLSDDEVKMFLGPDFLKWILSNLRELRSSSSGKNSKTARGMVEGLLGLLLHYAKSTDLVLLSLVRENHFMTIFLEQLSIRSHSRAKQRAALGLKYLSESAKLMVTDGDLEPQPRGFCGPFVFICGKTPMVSDSCPLHTAECQDDSSFCLLKGNAIKPLVDLISDESTEVQIAAVEALSTIVADTQSLKNATKELEELGLFDTAICLFKEVRSGELQERVIWMMERFFRVEILVQKYSIDQDLVKLLVEALKHGTVNTKRLARDVLTNLRELSGVGAKTSSQSQGRRTGR